MALTLKEIADQVGVSKMTVSRVLNGKTSGQVSAELAVKIKRVLAKHNYQPNQHARNLRAARTCAEPRTDDTSITLLLPCPDFLDKPIDLISEYVEISNAVLQTAGRNDFKVNMIPISRSNNPHEIEWAWLRGIGSGSRVLAYSAWFLPVLTELSRRGCRIAVISAEVFWRSAYESIVRNFALFTYMTVDGSMQLTEHLLNLGYRRPAIATRYTDEPEEPLVAGYGSVMEEEKLPYRNLIRLPGRGQKEKCDALVEAYRKNPFDALIMDCPFDWKFNYRLSLQKNIGLPEDVRILFREDCGDCVRFEPRITSVRYPRKKIGADAAEALLAKEFIPGEKFYRGELVVRGSGTEEDSR